MNTNDTILQLKHPVYKTNLLGSIECFLEDQLKL